MTAARCVETGVRSGILREAAKRKPVRMRMRIVVRSGERTHSTLVSWRRGEARGSIPRYGTKFARRFAPRARASSHLTAVGG